MGARLSWRAALAGPVRLWGADGAERGFPTRRARALLAYLLLARGRPVQRASLAALLWERSPEAEARASLRKALSALSAALQGAGPVLSAGREALRLREGAIALDLDRIGEELAGAVSLASAPVLMEGLDGLGEEWDAWLSAERMRFADGLRARLEAALEDRLSRPGDAEAAAAAARRLLALDATHEGAWRALIRGLAGSGDRNRALQEYERCRMALRSGLDLEPSSETRELVRRIRAGPGPHPGSLIRRAAPPVPAACPAEGTGPDRPLRVGVLPFTATGLGAEAAALAAAYARDTANELSRFRRFDIISPLALADRDSLLRGGETAGGPALDYLVDGSIREGAEERQVVVSLLEVTELIRPVWSEAVPLPDGARVDGAVLEALVARLDPALLSAIGRRPSLPADVSANGAILRAIPLLYSLRRDRFEQAGVLLAEAVAAEPENAAAAAWAAQWHAFHIGQGWAGDPRSELEEAERLASLAMRLDPTNAEAQGIYGHVCAFLHKDFDSAVHFLDRSLEMNPNQASIWALSAATQCYLGHAEEARRRLGRYRGLAPHHPHATAFEPLFTMAELFGGDYENAARVGRRAVRMAPDFVNGYKSLLAAMGHGGQKREARPYLEALLAREPGFTIRDFVRSYPFRRPEDRERYAEGLARAGAPLG